ncbi:MAG: hypothetical protein ACPGVS_08560, partial [Primorskyibacter sp.]
QANKPKRPRMALPRSRRGSYIDPANTRSRQLAERLEAARDLPAEQALNVGVCIYRHPMKHEV